MLNEDHFDMREIGKSGISFFSRLCAAYQPLELFLKMRGHRRLGPARTFFSVVVMDIIGRMSSYGISCGFLERAFVRNKQRITHHPSLVANPGRREMNILAVCLTYHCDRNCSFCYARGLKKKFGEHMSLRDFRFLAGWARAQGWRNMRLLGGEPTQHPNFAEILDIAAGHGLTLYLTTNGLFDPKLGASISRRVKSVCFSYPQDDVSSEDIGRFRANYAHALASNRILVLSWVIREGDEGWRKVLDMAAENRLRSMVRFSLVTPGHERGFGPEEFRERMKGLARQVVRIAEYAREKGVVFAFYRPLMLCMFDKGQLDFLRSISPFLFYTRCPLCLRGEYDSDLKLTVNPDLTCYPCTALAVEGVRIVPGTTRETLNARFSPLVREMTGRPFIEACRTCEFFAHYQARIGDKLQDLADRSVCQGGCFQYRSAGD